MEIDDLIRLVNRGALGELEEAWNAGGDFGGVDEDGRSLLMNAVLAFEPREDVVAWLVSHGADLAFAEEKLRYTALHFAAADQQQTLVHILLNAGAPVNAADKFGNTPLWRAVVNHRGDLELIQLLVDFGADPERQNVKGISPRNAAARLGKSAVTALFDRAIPRE